MTAETPSIADILESLRAEVRAQRAALGGAGDGQSAAERELRRANEEIEYTRVVSAHWPLEGKTPYEQAWALVNKVVRRYLRWYINPIVEQQNAYNDAAARAIRLLSEQNAELRRELAELRARLDNA